MIKHAESKKFKAYCFFAPVRTVGISGHKYIQINMYLSLCVRVFCEACSVFSEYFTRF